MRRRRLLTVLGGLGSIGLAGCSSGGGDDPDEDEKEDDDANEDPSETAPTTGAGTATTEPGARTTTEQPRSPLTLGFEDGLTRWSVVDDRWGRTTERAYTGSYSSGIEVGGSTVEALATTTPPLLRGGARIDGVDFYWREAEDSFGGGVALRNSDGDLEVFAGTNNPEWTVGTEVAPGAMTQFYDGDGYDRWVHTELAFDWGSGTVAVTCTDTDSGTTATDEYALGSGRNVETIEVTGYTSAEMDRGNGFQTDRCTMYWDDIRVAPATR